MSLPDSDLIYTTTIPCTTERSNNTNRIFRATTPKTIIYNTKPLLGMNEKDILYV